MPLQPLACTRCEHIRARSIAPLPPDAHSVGLAKSLTRRQALALELTSREQMMIQVGQFFDFEPHFHPWCAYHSDVPERAWAACEAWNDEGLCEVNTARENPGTPR